MSHSPLPWKIIHCGYGPIVKDASDEIIAKVDWGRCERDEANARLIVAAPDLLAACKDLLNTVALNLDDQEFEDIVTMDFARAAIAKAENSRMP
jgi:hypothetical protein